MSKRAGTFVTLDDLLDAVGTDAARWFFASRAAHVEIDFDIELVRKQSAENPVYYVQYAHARIASILRKAEAAGLAPPAERPRAAGRGARGGPRPRGRAPPRGRRGRGPGRGDPGHHRLRDGAGHAVPRASTATRASWIRVHPSGRRSAWRSPWPRRRGSRWRTRSVCWGSPRPSRCRASKASRPAPGRSPPWPTSRRRSPQGTSRSCRPHRGGPRRCR